MEKILGGYLLFSLGYLCLFYLLTKKNKKYRKFVLIGYVAIQVIYLSWRFFFTIPTSTIQSRVAGSLLYFSEFMGFIQAITLVVLFWKPYKRRVKTLASLKKLPTVDLLIATYNESEEILERTVIGCLTIDYPKELLNIYFCDDGDREFVKKLAKKHGVGYIARPTHDYAKAGNLNYALTQTNSEIIVTQDADMVPKREFLKRTLGYFSDSKVGFVQTPQTFFNRDIFQHNLYLDHEVNNEQDFFMRSLEEGKDRYNAVLYIGSNALFQRKALEEIGGFTTGVITEDMATGLVLQNAGWKGIFVNEALASGLSPETVADYVKQRDRWGRGNIQVIKKYNFKKLKNLTWIQKWFYLDGVLYWYSGIYKIIYLLCPFLYLTFHIASLQTSLEQLAVFWLPAYLSGSLMYKSIAQKKYSSFMSHIYELVTAPQVSWAVIKETLFSPKKNKKFHVTIKGIQESKSYFDWRACKIQLGFLVLNLFSLLYYLAGLNYPQIHWSDLISLNIYWQLYNIISLTAVVCVSIERPRIPMNTKVGYPGMLIKDEYTFPVTIKQLSENKVIVHLNEDEPYKEMALAKGESRLYFKNIKNVKVVRTHVSKLNKTLELTLEVTHLSRVNHYRWLNLIYSDKKYRVGDVQPINVKFYAIWKQVFYNRKTARKNQELLT